MDETGHASMETVRMNKAGELVDVALLVGPLIVNETKVGYVFSYRDIGDRKRVETKLQHDAMHDLLTGLPNRALFLDRLNLALLRGGRGAGTRTAACFSWTGPLQGDQRISGARRGRCAAGRGGRAAACDVAAARYGGADGRRQFAVLVENILTASATGHRCRPHSAGDEAAV